MIRFPLAKIRNMTQLDPKEFDKLGKLLREVRQISGQKLREVSESTGLSIGYISDIEHCRTTPSIFSLMRLCKHYEIVVNMGKDGIKINSVYCECDKFCKSPYSNLCGVCDNPERPKA